MTTSRECMVLFDWILLSAGEVVDDGEESAQVQGKFIHVHLPTVQRAQLPRDSHVGTSHPSPVTVLVRGRGSKSPFRFPFRTERYTLLILVSSTARN